MTADRRTAASVEQGACCHEPADTGSDSSQQPFAPGPLPCHLKVCCVQFAPVGLDAGPVVGETPVADLAPADDGCPGGRRDRPPVPPPRPLTLSA